MHRRHASLQATHGHSIMPAKQQLLNAPSCAIDLMIRSVSKVEGLNKIDDNGDDADFSLRTCLSWLQFYRYSDSMHANHLPFPCYLWFRYDKSESIFLFTGVGTGFSNRIINQISFFQVTGIHTAKTFKNNPLIYDWYLFGYSGTTPPSGTQKHLRPPWCVIKATSWIKYGKQIC